MTGIESVADSQGRNAVADAVVGRRDDNGLVDPTAMGPGGVDIENRAALGQMLDGVAASVESADDFQAWPVSDDGNGPGRAVCAREEIVEPPRISAETPEMSFGDHAWDGVRQLGIGLWNTATGVAELGANVAVTAWDTSPAGLALDIYGGVTGQELPSWLPSAERGIGRIGAGVETVRQLGVAIWDDPSILIQEYENLADQGRYGAIVGQAIADFGDLLIGSRGAATAAGAAGDLGRLANLGDSAADLARLESASESATALARAALDDPAFAAQSRTALLQTRAALEAVDVEGLPADVRNAVVQARSQLDEALGAPLPRNADEARRATPNVVAELSDEVLNLAARSPSLMDGLRVLEEAGWEITFGSAGAGSSANRARQQIILDPVHVSGDPAQAIQVLSHEVGHARYNYVPDHSSRDAFLAGTLADEGAATMENIRVQREILASGGPDIGIAGNWANHGEYNAAYDEFLRTGDATAARERIGQIFGNNEVTSTTGQTYAEYYGGWYDRQYPQQ